MIKLIKNSPSSEVKNDKSYIDLRLLLFDKIDPNKNLDDALEVIKSEISTCLFVEKFEFF